MQKGIYTQYVQSDNWKVLDILYDPPGIWYMQYFNLSGVFHIIIKHLPQSESGGFMWCPFVCLFVYSFDCRVCCWPQFSWATCTTGLPDVYSPPGEKFQLSLWNLCLQQGLTCGVHKCTTSFIFYCIQCLFIDVSVCSTSLYSASSLCSCLLPVFSPSFFAHK